MEQQTLAELRDALVAAGLAGPHQSHERAGTIRKIHALVEDDPEATFGLSGIERFSAGEILGFMAELTGCSPDLDSEDADLIDPDKTVAGIVAAAERLADAARAGASLLVATGHPTGLLEHHIRVVEAFVGAGGKLLRLREDEALSMSGKYRGREVRYVGGVGCLADWGTLRHTHSSTAMEALLEAEPWPDLVLGDHGFAGAAIERGIPTIAVMDINDHALAIAWAMDKDVTIVPMDDNRLPRLYEPSWSTFERIMRGEEGEVGDQP